MSLSFQEYIRHDATGLAELVKNRQVSAEELLNTAIQLSDLLNPALNAIITPMYDEARAQLSRVPKNAPFAGVPFLLKDLLSAYAGVPMSSGSRAMMNWKPDFHSHITQRFLDAGFVIFGKTNIPECGLLAVSEPAAFKPARNPWNLELSPGGSSGGSAAAVAARLVPVAGAGDGGGSIRIPASVCGLFGLKPSRGRVSNGPACGESWGGAVAQGVLTRTVRDSASVLDCIAGYHPGDPYTAPAPAASFASAVAEAPRRLKIAVSSKSPLGLPLSQDCAQALDNAVRKLLALGHHVEQVEPPISGDAVLEDYLNLYYGAVSAELDHWRQLLGGRDVDGLVEPATLLLKRMADRLPVSITERSRQRWHLYSSEMARFLGTHDLFLLPSTAQPGWPVGSMKLNDAENWAIRTLDKMVFSDMIFTRERLAKRSRRYVEMVPFTQLANLTGLPAMSVPMHVTGDGFPVGLQFIAPYGEERLLISLASQIEGAFPWDNALPKLLQSL